MYLPKKESLIFLLFFVLWNESFASELMTTASQIKRDKFSGQIYYTKEKNEINFQVGTNIFSGEKEGRKIVFKFDYGFKTTFYPWIKFGSNLQGYNLFFPSSTATVTNYYRSNYPGWLLGVGARLLLFPETIVNPAISFDFGYTYANTQVDDFYLGIYEFQGAILVSKKFDKVHPYGGFRVMLTESELKSKRNREKIKGRKDNFSLFFGLASSLFHREKVFFEFALGDEKTFSLGISSELN
ncbi:MAG TPA: hypothetical protein DHV62_09220 [Elusimicrobia bacterium]|jgi:hypothetical protein|nr:hypothetical protein [Elusimicrobiota bacterium]